MPRTHGYSIKGKRCYGTKDWGAKGRTNVIGALINNELLTVVLCDGNVNTDICKAWVAQDLLPKLPEKTVIVMDNAAFHKNKDMKNHISEAGHILEYLPTYSPDLNPIEHFWAKAKHIRRTFQCNLDDLFSTHIL
jgi:transposase